MNMCSCLVGNSSSGVREGAFIGVPVVNIGNRQNKRLHAENVIDVDYDSLLIKQAIELQINHGKYASNNLYGDGNAGKKIAEILTWVDPPIQKTIIY